MLALTVLAACSSKPAPTVINDPRPPEMPWPEIEVPQPSPGEGGPIRIGLLAGAPSIDLELLQSVRVVDPAGKTLAVVEGPSLLSVRPQSTGIELRRPDAPTLRSGDASLRLVPLHEGVSFKTKNNEYDGEMILLRAKPSGLTLVNRIELETYLRGVVPWEIGRPGDESIEAVKAQAISARTYTISHLGRRETLGFDLWDSVDDQVYRGLSGIHPVTDRAIEDTRGQILLFGDELVQSYYSSTCGGHTSRIDEVWPRSPIVYLQGTRDAPRGESAWCRESPHFRWSVAWSAKELGDVIRRHLPSEVDTDLGDQDIGVLRALVIRERDSSGRARRLAVITDRGEFEVEGDRIRWLLRPARGRFGILRSTLIEIENVRSDGRLVAVRVRGGGFGHGVGMCQIGALAMSRAGHDVEQILDHYYPGSHIGPLTSVASLP